MLSLVLTAMSAVFWDHVIVSQTLYWPTNRTKVSHCQNIYRQHYRSGATATLAKGCKHECPRELEKLFRDEDARFSVIYQHTAKVSVQFRVRVVIEMVCTQPGVCVEKQTNVFSAFVGKEVHNMPISTGLVPAMPVPAGGKGNVCCRSGG